MTERAQQAALSLGESAKDVNAAVDHVASHDIIARIWSADHTVWRDDPTEIADRLGWLHVLGEMREQTPELLAFANDVRKAGVRQVVLLGMGGSSLGPEVLRRTLGGVESYPELVVLDSTVPAWVASVTAQAKPATTLFLVSSKSGTTIESNALYRYFRRLTERAVGGTEAGAHFVAITDPGTPLEKTGAEQRFRRTFSNRADIGGRYSVLSYFGLVPAALAGVDIVRLLDRASAMAEECGPSVDAAGNPGAWLGAYMAATTMRGRDKLTLLASPSVASFGLWAEQLIAESTGKDGKGIVPVAGEPVLEPEAYGNDRAFVYLRREGDDNAKVDVAAERLAAAGHPLVRFDLRDKYDLGAEFFRWEFATAVASALLRVHPFDQPDVQAAKDTTTQLLTEFSRLGTLPEPPSGETLGGLLEKAQAGDYLALMVYAQPTDGVESLVTEVRRRVMDRYKIATTVGYGPRFLHSTGQLHKGGPETGLFAQLTTRADHDIPIPGEGYSFGTLAAAQALGDYRALVHAGRRVTRIDLGRDAEAGVLRLLASF